VAALHSAGQPPLSELNAKKKAREFSSVNSDALGGCVHRADSLAGTRVESATRQPAMAAAAAGALKVTAVATPSRPPTSYTAKRSAVEVIKQESDFLRHPLMEELVTPEPFINEAAMQLMKFHGSYMQDEREKRAFGKGKSYQFMMRTRQPAGVVSNQLYLAMDDLADQVRRPSQFAARSSKNP